MLLFFTKVNMLISVIIVSYNVRHYLAQCLDSLLRSAQHCQAEVEIFVVDNNSQDQSVEYLQAQFSPYLSSQTSPTLHLIANQRNLGFGSANNQALALCKGDYVLFLNPDTIVGEHCLQECLHTALQHKDLGAIGVKMLNPNGSFAPESRRGIPTLWTSFCKMSGLTRLKPHSRLFAHYYMGYLDKDTMANIEIVSGAFMFCAQKALKKCGGFDEDFFMYGEDIDLSYRFLKAGFRNLYLPTPILHYKGESTQKNSFRYVHVFYEAMLIFLRKHFPRTSFFCTPIIYCLIFLLAIATFLQQWGKAFAQHLHPYRQQRKLHLQFVGSPSLYAELHNKAALWNLQLSQAPTPSEGVDFWCYDMTQHKYTHLLLHMSQSSHQTDVAFYHPQWQSIITHKELFFCQTS